MNLSAKCKLVVCLLAAGLAGPTAASVLDLATNPQDVTFFGATRGGGTGDQFTSGDLNNDGFQDLVLLKPCSNFPSLVGPKRGAALVFFGPLSSGTKVDLKTSGPDAAIFGETLVGYKSCCDRLGRFGAVGDVSGDGVDDLILGEGQLYNAGDPQMDRRRGVLVVFGPIEAGTFIDLDSAPPEALDVRIVQSASKTVSEFGNVLDVADINGDGKNDILVGDIWDGTLYEGGAAYVFFGPFATGTDIDLTTATPDVLVRGTKEFQYLGASLAGADVSGDGTDDLIIASPGTKRLFALFGPLSSGTDLEFGSDTVPDGLTIIGDEQDFPQHVTHGDLSGDGFVDLVAGDGHADGPDGLREDAGEVTIFFGPFNEGTVIDMNVTEADVSVLGADSNDYLCQSSVIRIPWLGADSLVMGACGADSLINQRPDAGEANVLFGPFDSGATFDLAVTQPDIYIAGAEAGDHLGVSAIADMDGDGGDDLILGANMGDGASNEEEDSGDAYLFFFGGSPQGPPRIGNRLLAAKDPGGLRLSWESYLWDLFAKHYKIDGSDQKTDLAAEALGTSLQRFWTDTNSRGELYFYRVTAEMN